MPAALCTDPVAESSGWMPLHVAFPAGVLMAMILQAIRSSCTGATHQSILSHQVNCIRYASMRSKMAFARVPPDMIRSSSLFDNGKHHALAGCVPLVRAMSWLDVTARYIF